MWMSRHFVKLAKFDPWIQRDFYQFGSDAEYDGLPKYAEHLNRPAASSMKLDRRCQKSRLGL